MARRLIRYVLLFFAFTGEIQIHASQLAWLAEPVHCTFNDAGCAYQARIDKAELAWEDAKISAHKNAVLNWPKSQELQIISGSALVTLTAGKRLKIPTGILTGEAEILVERKGSATTVTCLTGMAFIKPVGATAELRLPAGFTQFLDSVDRSGQAQTEIPLTAPLSGSIKKWWKLFAGTKTEFLPKAKEFTKTVTANVEETSRWHADLVQREIAAQAEADRIDGERQKRVAEERKHYRDLFRKMNYLDQTND